MALGAAILGLVGAVIVTWYFFSETESKDGSKHRCSRCKVSKKLDENQNCPSPIFDKYDSSEECVTKCFRKSVSATICQRGPFSTTTSQRFIRQDINDHKQTAEENDLKAKTKKCVLDQKCVPEMHGAMYLAENKSAAAHEHVTDVDTVQEDYCSNQPTPITVQNPDILIREESSGKNIILIIQTK